MKRSNDLGAFCAAGGVVWTRERMTADARTHELFSHQPSGYPLTGDAQEVVRSIEAMEQGGRLFRSNIVERHDGSERMIQWRRTPRRGRT